MKYLLLILLATSALFFACKNEDQTQPCPDCSNLENKICVEGRCECSIPGASYLNEDWCLSPGEYTYLASFDDWYCLDTTAISLFLPDGLNPGGPIGVGNASIGIKNKLLARGMSLVQTMVYYPRVTGDSFVVRNIPFSVPNGSGRYCLVPDGTCEFDVFAKFRPNTKDTIDATLRLRCSPTSVPEHGDEKKVLFVKFN
jgi:hypothetical protein